MRSGWTWTKLKGLSVRQRLERKFWAVMGDVPVPTDDVCWVWPKPPAKDGYGLVMVWQRNKPSVVVRVHRLAYELMVGVIPDGLLVLHSCDNPVCVNPTHLWVGTQTDNMQDMSDKGRAGARKRRKLTTEQAREVRLLSRGLSPELIARRFGVSRACIRHIVSGRCYAEVH